MKSAETTAPNFSTNGDGNTDDAKATPNEDFIQVTTDVLNLHQTVAHVAHDSAGAITTFSGTTRKTFQGRRVVCLEYEAYIPMAERELRKLVADARAKWPLIRVALLHRLGVVPVGETSVIVAVSAEHRDASLEAARMLIDKLKETVPIWKKEVYEDGSVWKETFSGRC